MKMKRCARCPIGRPVRQNRICENCRTTLARYGLRWCPLGNHEVSEREYIPARHACRACSAAASRREWHQLRGQPADPPPGYVRLAVAAPVLGYTTRHMQTLIRLGRLQGWQRRRGGAWYVKYDSGDGCADRGPQNGVQQAREAR